MGLRSTHQYGAPGPNTGSGSTGSGSGTPNVAIAGTDGNGDPIQSPVLLGDAGLDNLTLDGGNTNTGFHGIVFGGGNDNTGDNNLTAGQTNDVTGDAGMTVGSGNTVPGNSNIVGGSNNYVDSDRNMVVGNSNDVDSTGGDNLVGGTDITCVEVNQSAVVGNASALNRVYQSILALLSCTIRNIENCIVVGADLIVGTLPGTVTKYSAIFGKANTVNGTSQMVSGQGHDVSGDFTSTTGQDNTVSGDYAQADGFDNAVPGNLANVSGEGNIAHYGQIVKGRFAVENVVSDTVPTPGQQVEIVGWGTDNANRKTIRSLDTVGNETLTGNSIFSNPIKGKKGNDGSAFGEAGVVGERLQQRISYAGRITLPNNTYTELARVDLTPGCWLLFGSAAFECISCTQNSINPTIITIGASVGSNENQYILTPTIVASSYTFGGTSQTLYTRVTAIASWYLSCTTMFSAGSVKMYGLFTAVRLF